ncbi:ionotropic receptor 75a-like [Hyposmocoma kahamanoa]|uniref:ionotropic receptor 75a-like n=1 Tax=Hyposmocoma kahamanoa TaxID=1477025 RepID=UPI000E6D952E|nr:ionotropic receptor 75a-like [Hyposmocoma kahamanoa]
MGKRLYSGVLFHFKCGLFNIKALHSNLNDVHHHLETSKPALFFLAEPQISTPSDVLYLMYPGYSLEYKSHSGDSETDRLLRCVQKGLDEILQQLPSVEVLILGDFNAHHMEWLGSARTDYTGRAVRDFAAAYDLTQLVDGQTRVPDIEGHTPGLLDLMLTSLPDGIRVSCHACLGTSDHLLIRSEVSVTHARSSRPPGKRRVWHYGSADWDGLREFYASFPWKQLSFSSGDPDVCAASIAEAILLGMHGFIPNSAVRVGGRSHPWFENIQLAKELGKLNMRVSVKHIDGHLLGLEKTLVQWHVPVGVLLDGSCINIRAVLDSASREMLFDSTHMWVIVDPMTYKCENENTRMKFVDGVFQNLNLSVDADIAVVAFCGDHYKLTDVFNFGKIQGNHLEKTPLGEWSRDTGLNISAEGFKYYHRWDFHNLTLRAVTVVAEGGAEFDPAMLEEVRYTPGIAAMTKVGAQMLISLMQHHNFRFNYTSVGRWLESPRRNSTLAVTNTLYWREQDIACTCLRLYPERLDWVDPFLPQLTYLETKVYYLIPDKGVGNYENRFLTPLSAGVWWSTCVVGLLCIVVLTGAATIEGRPNPGIYALCSVVAAACQQAYEDGIQLMSKSISTQGRRATLLVVGLTSLVLYTFYTSSVVSWLLNAVPPNIASLDGLIQSDLELVFEDVGYTRSWLFSPGIYYYSGYKNRKEDELREKKVTNSKRTVPLLQSPIDGVELIRTGAYAYHSEPYTASQVLSVRLSARELCDLGTLQVMPPSHVYIVGQKRSPYKQFFSWSLMRMSERGHASAIRARLRGAASACSGTVPRALALGQAAPAFALLAEASLFALLLLAFEILWHKFRR